MKKHDNALKTIGEVSKILNIPIYVLRFWEKKEEQIRKTEEHNKKVVEDAKEGEILVFELNV